MKLCGTFFLIMLAVACDKPQLDQPKVYNDAHVAFSYPGNWSVDAVADDANKGFSTIGVEASDSVVHFVVFDPPIPTQLPKLHDTMLREMAKAASGLTGPVELLAMKQGASEEKSRTLSGTTAPGIGSTFSLKILGVEVEFRTEAHLREAEKQTVFAFAMMPEEDVARDQPGVDLIFDTLVLK